MAEVIIMVILGTLVLIFRQFFVWLSDESKYEKFDAEGTLIRTTSAAKGGTRYYVSFQTVDGVPMEGMSIGYKNGLRKYRVGDKMKIQYMINKNGVAIVEVLDDSLIDNSGVMKIAIRIMTVIMLLLYGIAIGYLFAYLL